MFGKVHLILFFLFVLIFFFTNNINAQIHATVQRNVSTPSDSIIIEPTMTDSVVILADSSIFVLQNSVAKMPDTLRFKSVDPNKVVWFGAIVPGMGQILNRKYWKLPIVYGGFLVCAYAITWNGTQYNSYKNAYRDIIDNNPKTNSYLDLLPKGYTIDNYPGGISNLTQRLKSGQDTYRRYRDLSVLISVLYYGLTVLDAYVDAQLFNFDISPDLSMRVNPAVINSAQIQSPKNSNSFGVQLSLNF